MKQKLYIYKEEDRLTVASILVKNGYTVRISKERKSTTSKSNVYFVEAERTDEK